MKTIIIKSDYAELEVYDDAAAKRMRRKDYRGLQTPKQFLILKDKIIKENDFVIDVGAHIGTFCIPFAKHCKPQKVYAIEANENNYNLLVKNIIRNKLEDTIIPIRAIVSDIESTMKEVVPKRNDESWVLQYHPSDTGIKSTTLDNLLEDADRINFVKMDIEGSEIRALKGFKKLLEKHSPTMYIECSALALKEQNYQMKDLEDEVRSHGYINFVENDWEQGYVKLNTLNDSVTKNGRHGPHFDCIMKK